MPFFFVFGMGKVKVVGPVFQLIKSAGLIDTTLGKDQTNTKASFAFNSKLIQTKMKRCLMFEIFHALFCGSQDKIFKVI